MTENQRIMKQIHNEQRDFNKYLSGKEVYKILNTVSYLEPHEISLLWKTAKLKKTFFGEWITEDYLFKIDETDVYYKEIETLTRCIITSLFSANLMYENDQNGQPLEYLVVFFVIHYNEYFDIHLHPDEAYSILASFIECETIANWLLVSELPKQTNKD